MPSHLTCLNLQALLQQEGSGLACLDVREYGEYNDGHVPGSSPLPRRLLEYRMHRFVPDLGTAVAVCDDNGGRAGLAAGTLERMGYREVRTLEGGLDAWRAAGLPVEWGSNVPSKDFGERVQAQEGVPEMEPAELNARLARGDRIVLLDARTPEEHRSACIPGSRSMPAAELALRARAAAPPGTTIVVHCAGRTRSIIGAQTLRRMGFDDVYALKNGTMGWVLAGLTPEAGSDRVALPEPPADGLAETEGRARALASEDGVVFLDTGRLQQIIARGGNLYLVDVRTLEEYTAGHIPGSQWFPGGQAVQRADELIGVRTGVIVFCCDGVVRSSVTASWFHRMGFTNVSVLEGGTVAWAGAGLALESGMPQEEPFGYRVALRAVRLVDPAGAAETLAGMPRPLVLFVDTSREYGAGHLPGSFWLPRGSLEAGIGDVARDEDDPVLITSTDGVSAILAGAALRELGYGDVMVLGGGTNAWRAEGRPLETGLRNLLGPANDVVRAGTERTREEMLQYLEWEERLGEKHRGG